MPTDPWVEVALRPVQDADRVVLGEVHLASRRAASMPAAAHDDEAARAWAAALPEDHEVWVAEVGGQVVGFLALRDAWVDSLYVTPAAQRHGVGSALLDVAKGLRPDGFGLWVFAVNRPARAFYAAHGLVELEETDGSATDERSPDVRVVWPGERPLSFLRARIDEVDDELAELLARRTALTAAVQDHKAVALGSAGRSGRDPGREAEIVARMAAHAPGLDAARLARVMHVVIEESLAAWEQRGGDADRA